MRCEICGNECEETYTMRPTVMAKIKTCRICFNLYANHDYDDLLMRLNKNNHIKNKGVKNEKEHFGKNPKKPE